MRRGVRSTTGCHECRSSRVKCDEARPICSRCKKRGSDCTYKQELKWRNEFVPLQQKRRRTAETRSNEVSIQNAAPSSSSVTQEYHDTPGNSALICGGGLVDFCTGEVQLSTTINDLNLLPSPDNPRFSTLSPELGDNLMNFYFDKIAPVFCCYSGGKNPFHHLIAKAWNSEARYTRYGAMVCATQSIAAAFLSAKEPQLQAVARNLQQQAHDHLETSSVIHGHDSISTLALVLLGASVMYVEGAAPSIAIMRRVEEILTLETVQAQGDSSNSTIRLHDRERRFFWNLQVFCEVYFTFTDPQYFQASVQIPEKYFQEEIGLDRYPHPYTGVSGPMTVAFLSVGQLIRRQRQLATSHAFASQRYINELQSLLSQASALEETIYTQTPPSAESIEDPHDRATPVEHLIKIAQSHRDTALLQLYRVFPDLLARRLGSVESDSSLPTQEPEEYLVELALQNLGVLASIPSDSGTTPFQTVLLLCTASELRFSRDSSLNCVTSAQNIMIAEARETVIKRLGATQRHLPGQRLYRFLRRAKQVWARLDAAKPGETVYWLDVAV